MTCIDYQHITKKFGKRCILDDLSLSLAADATTAIVGGSGSGKTTLLQLANGLLVADAGTVSVFGQVITADTRQSMRLGIGYSQQGAGLFPHLTIFDNVTIMARLQGWSQERIRQRYELLMQLMNLHDEFDARYPYSLSGGQQQRVSLCRAMMLGPPLLLLDEPFSALDPVTRDEIHREFLRLQQAEARSIVLVTHDMFEAVKLAQRIVVLQDGKVIQHGTVEEVKNNPATDYVATLFSSGSGIESVSTAASSQRAGANPQ